MGGVRQKTATNERQRGRIYRAVLAPGGHQQPPHQGVFRWKGDLLVDKLPNLETGAHAPQGHRLPSTLHQLAMCCPWGL